MAVAARFGLDWRFVALAVLSTPLTALLFTLGSMVLFPFGLFAAVAILPVTLPAAVVGWIVGFLIALRLLSPHHAAWVAAGCAAVFSVAAIVAISLARNGADLLQGIGLYGFLALCAVAASVFCASMLYGPTWGLQQ